MKWKLFAVVVVLAVVLVVGLGRRRSAQSGSGSPQRVPPEGLTMREFNGTKTPVPIAFYPNGKIYGMIAITPKTGRGAMAIEGTYDDPQTVAAHYQRFYQDTTKVQSLRDEHPSPSWESATSAFRLWRARAENPTGYMIISVCASSEGYSRDIAKWDLSSHTPDDSIGGDPKETMIWLLIRWKQTPTRPMAEGDSAREFGDRLLICRHLPRLAASLLGRNGTIQEFLQHLEERRSSAGPSGMGLPPQVHRLRFPEPRCVPVEP